MSLQDIAMNDILRADGFLASVWQLIESGSVELELSQEKKLGGVVVTRDSIIVNVCDPGRLKEILIDVTLGQGFLKIAGGDFDANDEKKEDEPGVREILDMLQDTADAMRDIEKTMILQYDGRDVVRAGNCRTCTTMKIMGHRNMEIVSMMLLARLAKGFFLG